MSEKKCTRCNSNIELAQVDGIESPICRTCSAIEFGYSDSEAAIVHDLQEYFREEDSWRIHHILGIYRKHFAAHDTEIARLRAALEDKNEWRCVLLKELDTFIKTWMPAMPGYYRQIPFEAFDGICAARSALAGLEGGKA